MCIVVHPVCLAFKLCCYGTESDGIDSARNVSCQAEHGEVPPCVAVCPLCVALDMCKFARESDDIFAVSVLVRAKLAC